MIITILWNGLRVDGGEGNDGNDGDGRRHSNSKGWERGVVVVEWEGKAKDGGKTTKGDS